jgi:hypothetical protein
VRRDVSGRLGVGREGALFGDVSTRRLSEQSDGERGDAACCLPPQRDTGRLFEIAVTGRISIGEVCLVRDGGGWTLRSEMFPSWFRDSSVERPGAPGMMPSAGGPATASPVKAYINMHETQWHDYRGQNSSMYSCTC